MIEKKVEIDQDDLLDSIDFCKSMLKILSIFDDDEGLTKKGEKTLEFLEYIEELPEYIEYTAPAEELKPTIQPSLSEILKGTLSEEEIIKNLKLPGSFLKEANKKGLIKPLGENTVLK